ncbi:DUF47 domain-containing protein [Staphylothermus hellenicus]|uniref:Phosphate transport regulator n=1 Tax=Staphylothermus hellenicus (strain DSM 12710 / JCM 10830 / BK20S6-10-b1 / P8) TaxID=591019 RepID=D7D9I3_STAHD|nr:DUF47 family protein [Staphylothermus hellenicus]ADI32429.1 hypothetical protein Shell_1337 [Staphylothermus hellenicus DSM 12710]
MAEYGQDTLAEIHVYENMVNLLNQADDVIKAFTDVLSNLLSDQEFDKLYNKIQAPKIRVEENRLMLMEYLIRLGETLPNRQNYISIALGIDRLVQLLDGASYRLTLLRMKGYRIDQNIYDQLKELASTVIAQYHELNEGLNKLKTDPKKTIMHVREISRLENKADELYRNLTFTIYTKYENKIVPLMVLKDAIDFLENAADLLKALGEELRFLALHRILIT